MDEKLIIKMYVEDDLNLREVARKLNTNHKLISKILRKNNIEISRKKPRTFTEEHKKNIGEGRRKLIREGKFIPYNKGLKMKNYVTKNGIDGNLLLYKNMCGHLRIKVDLDWLLQFKDFEKLKYLNNSITRKRDFGQYDKDFYISYITKFYYDEKFNIIYNNWLSNNREFYLQPSPDHIISKNKKGELSDINNLQFLTWFENKCKTDIDQNDWDDMKKNIKKYFI